MQKTKSILYGFHDDDLESFIKRALQAQGYEVVSTVKYGISSIVQYAAGNPIDAIIMRCNTMSELEKARDLRDLNATLILLVTAGMRGTPEIEEALSSGLNNIVFAGLRSHSKNLRTEIVDIIREERSQKQARVYYGFAPLERPACFSGELSIKNEQQLLMLYEYLLDKTDPRELDVRFEKVLGMLPAEERSEMARTLPVPIKSLLRDSVFYQQAMTPERKKKGGFFRKKQEEPQEDSAGTEVALSGSSNLMDTINQLVEQYHHHQFGEWEVVRPATEQEEGEERRRCACGYEETRKIPKVAPQRVVKTSPSQTSVFGVGFSQGNVHWGPEERVEPTCETDGQIVRRGENDEGQVVDQVVGEIPALGHIPNEKTDEPDCVHSGRVISRCSRCGKVLHQKMLPPTGIHSWSDWTLESNAVCGTEGKKIRTCSVCGKTEEEVVPATDQHAFSDWTVTRAATCEESGVQVRKCTICGKEETQEIPALGHDYEKVIGKEANCSQPGYYQLKCRRCGAVQDQEEIIPPTDQHVFSEWEVEKPATCVEEGKRKHTCTLCGYIKEEVIPKAEHTYQKIVAKEPTCSEDGYYNLKCSVCGHMQEQTEIIPATGKHIFADWQIIKQATCKQPGIKERFCTLCGQKETIQIPQKDHEYQKIIIKKARCQKDGVYDLKCIHCGDRKKNAGIIPGAKQHSFSQRLIKSATCTIPGLCENRCSICGITEKQEIPAAHQPRGKGIVLRQATCTEEGQVEYTCSICGEKYIATIPYAHKYGKWEVIKKGATCADLTIRERTCSLCGKKEQDEQLSNVPHTFELFIENEVTCERDGRSIEICTTCGATKRAKKIQAMGHRYEKETVIEPTCQTTGEYRVACQNCGMVTETGSLEALGHLYGPQLAKEATCTESGKIYQLCARCQDEKLLREIPPLGHDYGSEIIKKEPTCTTQGEEYQVCNRCQAKKILHITPELGHKPQRIVLVPPSCSESGKYQMICERCSEAVSEEENIPELDHDFSEWTIQKAADCEHTGERVRTCKKCGIQESRTISKLGHEWVDKKTLPTCIAEGRLERVCMRCGKTELVETLPVAGHAFGKWKMSGFKDTRTCEVCGKVESRTAYKRIVAVAVCGAAIVGVAGVAIFLKKSASSEGSDYMDSKNVVHSTALIDESRESGETVSDFSKADLQVANDGKATSAATLTSAAFEEESETVEAVTETIEEGSDTLVQETDSEEETISAEAFTEEAKEDSQKWESTFEESRIESSESQTTELEIESTQPESIEFTSEAVMPEETDYGAITNLFLPTTLKTPETLQQLLTDWESRRKLLHWDTGILGDSSAYLVSQAQLEKLSASANGEIANWQKNEQNTVAETLEEQAEVQTETQASEPFLETQTSAFENQ